MSYYTVEDNFTGVPNSSQLDGEIRTYINDNPGNITSGFNGITMYTNETDISMFPFIAPGKTIILLEFNSTLSTTEKTFLDAIVVSHISDFTPTEFSYQKEVIFKRDKIRNTTYISVIKSFVFPGTTCANASYIGYMDKDITSYDIKIIDISNQQILCETNLSNTVNKINILGNLVNLSPNPWLIEVFIKKNGGSHNSNIYMDSININYD